MARKTPAKKTTSAASVALVHPGRPSRVIEVAAGMVGTYKRNGWVPAGDVDAEAPTGNGDGSGDEPDNGTPGV